MPSPNGVRRKSSLGTNIRIKLDALTSEVKHIPKKQLLLTFPLICTCSAIVPFQFLLWDTVYTDKPLVGWVVKASTMFIFTFGYLALARYVFPNHKTFPLKIRLLVLAGYTTFFLATLLLHEHIAFVYCTFYIFLHFLYGSLTDKKATYVKYLMPPLYALDAVIFGGMADGMMLYVLLAVAMLHFTGTFVYILIGDDFVSDEKKVSADHEEVNGSEESGRVSSGSGVTNYGGYQWKISGDGYVQAPSTRREPRIPELSRSFETAFPRPVNPSVCITNVRRSFPRSPFMYSHSPRSLQSLLSYYFALYCVLVSSTGVGLGVVLLVARRWGTVVQSLCLQFVSVMVLCCAYKVAIRCTDTKRFAVLMLSMYLSVDMMQVSPTDTPTYTHTHNFSG